MSEKLPNKHSQFMPFEDRRAHCPTKSNFVQKPLGVTLDGAVNV